MGISINADEIRSMARGDWINIITGIDDRFSQAAEAIGKHVPCPIGTGSVDGFRFEDSSPTDGHAFSNTGEKLGNGFQVLMWSNGWNFRQALEAVHNQLGSPKTKRTTSTPAISAPPTPPAPNKKPEVIKKNTIPIKIWKQSAEEISDPVKKYLEKRGLSEVTTLPKSLRSNDGIDYSTGTGKARVVHGVYPALIGEFIKDGEIVGIQRHYLTNEGDKADLKNPKLMLATHKGACSGAAVHLEEPKEALAIAEGIETALSVQLSTKIPTWAATTAPILSKIKVPEAVKTVYIFADKDQGGAGKKAAHQLSERLISEGKNVFIFMPPVARQEHEKSIDWLDVLNKIGKDPFIQAIKASKNAAETKDDRKTSQKEALKLTDSLYVFPETTEKGAPLNVYENFTYMLRQYGIICRYDVIKKDVDVSIPHHNFSADNGKTSVRAHILSTAMRNKFPSSLVDDYLNLEAEINHINPVIEWITSKPWDGTHRWEDFIFDTIKTEEEKSNMAWILISRWMLSAIAMAENGVKGGKKRNEAHGILIFTGAQGMGKTSWFKKLVPEGSELALDGFLLDPNNKDSVRTAISHWLVELGEIDSTFRKSDLSALKAFVTRPTDKLRKPYGRDDSNYPRRTVFFGSVNDRQFLMDSTGNRRYWVIEPTGIDYLHDFNMQQVWAEAYTHYKGGMKWWLTPEEEAVLNMNNSEYEATDPLEELLLSRFDFFGNDKHLIKGMSATDILQDLGYINPKKGDTMKISRIVEKITGKKSRKSDRKRLFDMPPQFATHKY